MTWRDKWEELKENFRHMGKHEEEHRHSQETKVSDPHHSDDVAGSEFLGNVEGEKTNRSPEDERRDQRFPNRKED